MPITGTALPYFDPETGELDGDFDIVIEYDTRGNFEAAWGLRSGARLVSWEQFACAVWLHAKTPDEIADMLEADGYVRRAA